MKRLWSFALATAFAFGLVSCSKDADGGSFDNGTDEVLTFSIKNPKGAFSTRADGDEIAQGEEWDMNTIDIYAFDGGNMIGDGKMVEGVDYDATEDGRITTVKVKSTWLSDYAGKTLNFYFVANDAAGQATGAPHIGATPVTTETAFVNMVTKDLAVDGDSKAALIETPLLFSATESVQIKNRVKAEINMKRREARFDIVNKANETFEISAIKVTNAKRAGYIFADGTGATFKTANMQEITCPVTADYDEDGLATSVFYLYPTELGKESGQTEIIVEAEMDGKISRYTLAGDDPVEILANTRYKLILNPYSLTFIVVAADYDEGEDVPTEGNDGDEDITFDGFDDAANTGDWDEDAMTYKFDDANAHSFTFSTTTEYGTSYEMSMAYGTQANFDAVEVDVERVAVYSAYQVVNNYEVKFPAGEDGLKVTIDIFSPNGTAKETISIVKEGGVPVASLVTDPALVSYISTTYATGGLMTTEDIEAVTEIKVNSKGIESLEGIENFPNLELLYAYSNANLKEVDVTNNPALKDLRINATGITSIDVSQNPALETLYAHTNPNLTSVDVSNNPALKNLRVYNTGITSVDVNQNPALEYLSVDNTGISSIDVSQNPLLDRLMAYDCPNLTTININGATALNNMQAHRSNLNSLDASQNPALETLYLYSCTNLTSVNVTGAVALRDFQVQTTQISSLDLSTNSALDNLRVSDNPNLTSIDVTNNPALKDLRVFGTAISSIDVSQNPALEILMSGNINIVSIDVSNNPALKDLRVNATGVSSLDVSQNYALEYLNFRSTNISSIDLSQNPALTSLYAYELSNMTELDISKNDKLTTLLIQDNPKMKNVYVWSGFDCANPASVFTAEFNKDNTPAVFSVNAPEGAVEIGASFYVADKDGKCNELGLTGDWRLPTHAEWDLILGAINAKKLDFASFNSWTKPSYGSDTDTHIYRTSDNMPETRAPEGIQYRGQQIAMKEEGSVITIQHGVNMDGTNSQEFGASRCVLDK